MSDTFESTGDSTVTPANPGGSPTTIGTKFYQVSVPDFSMDGGGGNSFLRLGSAPAPTDTTPGFQASYALAQTEVKLLSANDASFDPANLSDDKALLTQGGVWDHTDGNRIVTTLGDKIEIIKGNYSLVVSGSDNVPVNTSVSAPYTSTLTGSQAAPIGTGASLGPATPPGSMPMTADLTPGDVFVGTWANRVLTYVGSAPTPVPVVYTETYAGTVTNNTYTTGPVNVLTQATGASVTTTTTTSGGGVNLNTNVTGGTFTTANAIVGGTMMTNNEADAITTTNTAAALTTVNTAANNFTFTFGAVETINIGPAIAAINVGLAVAAVNVGAIATINIGPQLVVNVPSRLQFSLDEQGFHVTKTDSTAAEDRLKGIETNISNAKTGISLLSQRVNGEDTQLATQKTQINTLFDVLSGQVLLA